MPREIGGICSRLLQFLAKHISLYPSKTVTVGSRRHEGSDQSVSHGEGFEVAIEQVDKLRISISVDEVEKNIARMNSEAAAGRDENGKDKKEKAVSKDEKMLIPKKGKLRVVSNIDEISSTFIKERKESFAN